ncbi:MAG: hypothetical protein ACOC88_00895 [Candidatus Bipolaricaulota bacterium]
MEVEVSGRTVRIFSGVRVEGGIRACSGVDYSQVASGEKVTLNDHGDRVMEGG